MLLHRNIIRCRGHAAVRGLLRLSRIRRREICVVHLAVLVVGKADGAVAAPLPRTVGGYTVCTALRVRPLQLRQQLRLSSVLIPQAVGPAAAAVPAIRQLEGQHVLATVQQLRHVVRLVLDALRIAGVPRRQHRRADARTVEAALIQTTGGDIQPCRDDAFGGKHLSEAVHRVARLRVYLTTALSGLFISGVWQSFFAPYTCNKPPQYCS